MNATNLPVLVWIYGGAFIFGNGSYYQPDNFIDAGDLVFVTFNYRVGKFLTFLRLFRISSSIIKKKVFSHCLNILVILTLWIIKYSFVFFKLMDNRQTIFEKASLTLF